MPWKILLATIFSCLICRPSLAEDQLLQCDLVEISLDGANVILNAAQAKAKEMKLAVNISVVDRGGHLIAFARMEGARPASIYTSITKATSAALKRGETGPLPPNSPEVNTHLSLSVEGAAAISGGKFTTLKGGVPIVIDSQIVGAVGVGGATGEQDAEIAKAGINALIQKTDPKTTHIIPQGTWLIEDLEGRGVIDFAQSKITFESNGQVTCFGGVQDYGVVGTIDDAGFHVANIPSGMKLGPPALMDQERRCLEVLRRTTSFYIDPQQRLYFRNNNGSDLARATQINKFD